MERVVKSLAYLRPDAACATAAAKFAETATEALKVIPAYMETILFRT